MGQRSPYETLAAVMLYFLEHRTARQAQLQADLGVTAKTIRRCLTTLQAHGVPLESEPDHPDVFWSISKNWFPGAVAFHKNELPKLIMCLKCAPASRSRNELLAKITKAGGPSAGEDDEQADVPDEILQAITEAAAEHRAARLRYPSATNWELEQRTVSIHRIVPGPPVRVLATCHRTGTLKTFRASRIASVAKTTEPFRPAADADVAKIVDTWVDGYHGGGEPVHCAFRVNGADAKWIAGSLPRGNFKRAPVGTDLRISIETPAIVPLARYVAGLGPAVVAIETPELREAVANIARAALAVTRRAPLVKARPPRVAKRRSRA